MTSINSAGDLRPGSAKASIARSARRQFDRLVIVSIVLAVLGGLVSAYLAVSKLTNTEVVCIADAGSCELVNNSIYAQIGPFPIALFGLAGYIAILGALIMGPRLPVIGSRDKLVVFGLTLFGFLFSGYLTIIEAFVLHAWCQWCVASAVIMTVLFVIAFIRLWRGMSTMPEDEEAD